MPLLTAEDYLRFPAPPPDRRCHYGPHPQHFADLYLPTNQPDPTVIVLIHGGCYRQDYDLQPMASVARALTEDGHAVWNIEYRRAGLDGHFPNMFRDVAMATDFLPIIAAAHNLNLNRLISVGHSAGGHLALWLAARHKLPAASPLYSADALPIAGVVALAAICDLPYAAKQGLCSGPLPIVMGGLPEESPAHYATCSPRELLPLKIPQTHIVGSEDGLIMDNVQRYIAAAESTTDDPRLIVIPGVGHFEPVAASAPAFQITREAIQAMVTETRLT